MDEQGADAGAGAMASSGAMAGASGPGLRPGASAPEEPLLAGSIDPRLTQSWHSGAVRREVVPPRWPLSRSFSTCSCGEGLEPARPFGGIERRPKPKLPTAEDRAELTSFSFRYQGIHHQKPHVVAFVNSRSGGQTGQLLMKALSESIGAQEHEAMAFTGEVCDLSRPDEPVKTIESLAAGFAQHAQRRLLICGGDGTVTWILTALEQCKSLAGKHQLLPAAIVPLGTGNDLARSLGWGKSLRCVSDVLKYLQWVTQATPVTLDQWRLVLRPHEPLPADHKLRTPGSHPQLVADRDLALQLIGDLEETLGDEDLAAPASGGEVFVGFWQNYFSLGMDAKVAGYVDYSRSNTCCGRACFRRGCGKACYAWQGLRHSCCTPSLTPSISGLRISAPEDDAASPSSSLRELQPPLEERRVQGRRGHMQQMMLLNINSYAAGLNVLPAAGAASPLPSPADGVLEVLGVRGVAAALGVYAGLSKPAYVASARAVVFRYSRGEFMQLDGEPWKLGVGCDVLVEPHRKLAMLCAPPDVPFWRGHIQRDYWCRAAAPGGR